MKAKPRKPAGKSPKGGRPRKSINFATMRKLAEMQCTAVEIAGFFRCSEDTISRRVQERYGQTFAEFIKENSEGGKTSLRRVQWAAAMKGREKMQIWLGKQYLGQKEKLEHTGADGGPIQHDVSKRELASALGVPEAEIPA